MNVKADLEGTDLKACLADRQTTAGPDCASHRAHDSALTEIATAHRLTNAALVETCSSGSVNAALHLPAIAAECGSECDGPRVAKIFKKTPCIPGLKPRGRDVAKDIFHVLNIPLQIKKRLDYGDLHGDCMTVSGPAFSDNKQPGRRKARPVAMYIVAASLLTFGPQALAFDGSPVSDGAATPVAAAAIAPGTPGAAAAIQKTLPSETTLSALQYQAEGGHPVAQFKLGQMYASGNGVTRDDLRAFEYFSTIANGHADDPPSAPQAKIVANAFVSLGQYYLAGIPNSRVSADPERAREMFAYAASYFGDAEAQYNLGRLYLNGPDRDPRSAARWLGLAAKKGQHQAQALLGQMLFNGDRVPRQAAQGLMWMLLAKENATPDETWIVDAYNRSLAKASEDDRAMAGQMLGRWVQGRRD